ncbi:MAG: 5'/3'-nucleotidase SurE [Thermodesulfobacteriota bacterium]
MNIVLTNDDGVDAPGLAALYRELSRKHEVKVVAPAFERSAAGHSISIHEPLRVRKVPGADNSRWYAVFGKPADCMKLALLKLLETKPDLVISGINAGVNDGVNIHYSGTVAAAREACLNGVPAMAVSTAGRRPAHFQTAAVVAGHLVDKMAAWGVSHKTLLNVNVPDLPLEDIAGVRFTRQDMAIPGDWVEKRRDPRGGGYYWYGYTTPQIMENSGTDREALSRNYVSITPLVCDTTDEDMLKKLKKIELNIKNIP